MSPRKARRSMGKVAVPLDKGPPYRVRVKRKSMDQTRFGNRCPSFAPTLEDLWGVASLLSFNPNSRPRWGAASREPSQTSQSLGQPSSQWGLPESGATQRPYPCLPLHQNQSSPLLCERSPSDLLCVAQLSRKRMGRVSSFKRPEGRGERCRAGRRLVQGQETRGSL